MITSSESAPDPRRRSEKSRRATLVAALELCAENGYSKVTIEAIAARAGVSKKTIYRWWPTKGAVLLDAVTEQVVSDTTFPDTGDIDVDLCTHIGSLVKVFTAPVAGAAYTGILAELLHDEQLARAVNEELVIPRVALVYERMRRAQEQGQLPLDIDLPLAVEMLYGPLYYRHALGRPLHEPERIEELVAYVMRGLRASGSS
ncbi:TetR/AcrR family transcriptional regulator [Streptomyces sp. ASQP_92]|uniref:TetR/AcrR family transcriptional regulator n=1 Tax=unclassified Streptomyces TaxID=2593676 RepID=UPI0021BF64B2|nr:TetR/AcrR family transcriptional regulator [Streptomyces sp. ASQP_92]MCT9089210.1 TetR/AcrR family transcriptional regulator [Streptomyces sp. ASQP_92]